MEFISQENGKVIEIEKVQSHISDSLVEQLIALRKEQHMTQQDIADATGMQRANVARIEGRRYTPTLDVLMRYAKCLGMEIEITLKKK